MLKPENLVFRYLEQEAIESSPLRNARFLVCEPGLGSNIANLIPRLVERYMAHDSLLNSRLEQKNLESQILKTLAQLVSSDNRDAKPVSSYKRNWIFRRALEFIESLPHSYPLTMPEFAEAVGVSQRLLEIVFKEKYNKKIKRESGKFKHLYEVICFWNKYDLS